MTRRRRSTSTLSGVTELRRGLRKAPNEIRRAVLEEIEDVTEAVHRDGLRNISAMVTERTGELRKHYKRRVLKRTLKGRVGYHGKRAKTRAYYARFVHDGTVKTAARPFHDRAVAKHVDQYRRAMRRVGSLVLGKALR